MARGHGALGRGSAGPARWAASWLGPALLLLALAPAGPGLVGCGPPPAPRRCHAAAARRAAHVPCRPRPAAPLARAPAAPRGPLRPARCWCGPGGRRGAPPPRIRRVGRRCGDWREFRAGLVERERRGAGLPGNRSGGDWAHLTPLIERGSVLLAAPGDHFVLDQQYFHKAVILVVRHDEGGTMGLVLNRPSAFDVGEVGLRGAGLLGALLELLGVRPAWEEWSVWFGGDCQGLSSPPGERVCFCLHTADRFSGISDEVIGGLFLIDLVVARALVALGQASRDEFLVVAGYCGWAPGQLQAELGRGRGWITAAAGPDALLGNVSETQAQLSSRLRAARDRGLPPSATDVGDGVGAWHRLLAEVNMTGGLGEDRGHSDAVLQQWIDRLLTPPRPEPAAAARGAWSWSAGLRPPLRPGLILRSSATAWLLGKPVDTIDASGSGPWEPPSSQYLHKAVLLLLEHLGPQSPSAVVLLNGPKMGVLGGTVDIFFGGTARPRGGGLVEVPGGGILGRVPLPPGRLERLVSVGAFEVARGVDLDSLLAAPPDRMWEAAGGRIETIADAVTARLGDEQRRKWYQRFLGMNLPADL